MSTQSRHSRTLSIYSSFLVILSSISFAQVEKPKPNSRTGAIGILAQSPYKLWLEEDAAWIITDEERAVFKHLRTDEERDLFIEAFWSRRDPTPDTFENEFEDEHYRRMTFANERYGGIAPGWKSDRGRIYIVYGPADQIEKYPDRREPADADNKDSYAAVVSKYPLEIWHYGYLEGLGQDVVLTFVDICHCGDYRMTLSEAEKDALLYTPGTISRRKSKVIDPVPFLRIPNPPTVHFKDLEQLLNGNECTTTQSGNKKLSCE
jgi:GWxTD domain-containing protein